MDARSEKQLLSREAKSKGRRNKRTTMPTQVKKGGFFGCGGRLWELYQLIVGGKHTLTAAGALTGDEVGTR